MDIIAIQNKIKLDETLTQNLLKLLSTSELQRYNRFLRWQDAQSNLLGRVAIKNIIAKKYGVNIGNLIISKNSYGKLYYKSNSEFHFNISHSNEWVVIVTSNNRVGIDIEEIKDINIDLAQYFFSQEEKKQLEKKTLKQQKFYFYDLWTLKESYIKADGRGLSIPLNSFTIKINNEDISCIGIEQKYFFKQYNIDENYKLAICSSKNEFSSIVNITSNEDLSKSIIK